MSAAYDVDTRDLTLFARNATAAEPIVLDEMTRAMEASTRIVMGEARSLVRVRSGETQRRIGQTVRRVGPGVEGEIRSAAPWSRWLEHGRGAVYPVRAKVLRWVSPGGSVVFSRRSRPAAARPFMRPALGNTRAQVRSEFARVGGRVWARWGRG